MPVNEKQIGFINDKPVVEYTLTNTAGMQVSIMNYGGTVTKIITEDRHGKPGDVVLGFEHLQGYLQSGNPYMGSLVGRFGNRIANACFILNGNAYQLAANNNGHSLHGGIKGFDKAIWDVKDVSNQSLELTYNSPDGEEGFPGNLSVSVVYRLTEKNELEIDYRAVTDKATPVNLTSHCYFNLSGGMEDTIHNHELMIDANCYLPVDEFAIPTGKIMPVKYSAFDFRKAKKVGKDIIDSGIEYHHNFYLNKNYDEMHTPACSLYNPASGRFMEVFTTKPGMQLYTSNFLDGSLQDTKNGVKYLKHAGLCLEAQYFPDSPNQYSFPNSILQPGHTYHHTTSYRFGIL